jgi:hypothetical protein
VRLPKNARQWLMRHGNYGATPSLHCSDDYPRVLEARGLVVRKGRGMLGHAHELEITEAGAAVATRLLIERLLGRREP